MLISCFFFGSVGAHFLHLLCQMAKHEGERRTEEEALHNTNANSHSCPYSSVLWKRVLNCETVVFAIDLIEKYPWLNHHQLYGARFLKAVLETSYDLAEPFLSRLARVIIISLRSFTVTL